MILLKIFIKAHEVFEDCVILCNFIRKLTFVSTTILLLESNGVAVNCCNIFAMHTLHCTLIHVNF